MRERAKDDKGDLLPEPRHMREMVLLIGGYRISQAIYVAAELGIADVLNERPRTPSELAETVGAHEDSLYRVLRMLAGVGVLSETTEGTFQLTQLGAALRSDVRGTPSRNVKAMLYPAVRRQAIRDT
jgi:hypothetical protein